MIVLPLSAIEELNSLPWTTADPTGAHVLSLCGPYTGVDLLLKTNLHYRVLQRKLTPKLGLITAPMEQELSQAVEDIFPACETWVRIKTSDILLALFARMNARVFVGLPFCRDKTWLDISTKFTETSKLLSVAIMTYSLKFHSLHYCNDFTPISQLDTSSPWSLFTFLLART